MLLALMMAKRVSGLNGRNRKILPFSMIRHTTLLSIPIIYQMIFITFYNSLAVESLIMKWAGTITFWTARSSKGLLSKLSSTLIDCRASSDIG
jgi:hypothetical protein